MTTYTKFANYCVSHPAELPAPLRRCPSDVELIEFLEANTNVAWKEVSNGDYAMSWTAKDGSDAFAMFAPIAGGDITVVPMVIA